MILTWFANLDGELPRDSQQLHGLVAAEFPNEGRVLYAVPDRRIIAVQHRHPVQRSVTPLGLVMEERRIEAPATGLQVEFSLIGNATVCKAGKRRALPEDKHEAWGHRMLADALNIHDMECETLTPSTGWRKGAKLTHHRVCYHGHGTVKNQANLERLMMGGVGRAKAYGCGLLVVNPL